MKKVKELFNFIICDNELYAFFIVFLLFFIVFVKNEFLILSHHDDVTHASIAKMMVRNGNYMDMYEGREVSFLKPPLYFWIEAFMFKLFGPSDYFARFPSSLFGFFAILLSSQMVRKLFNDRIYVIYLIILSTSFYFLKYSKLAMLDIPITFWMVLSIYSFVRAEIFGVKKYYILFSISLSAGYYTKAIQGLYPLIVCVAYFVLSGNFKKIFSKEFISSVLLSFMLISLWFVPEYLKFGKQFLYSQCGIGPILNRGLPGGDNKFYNPFLKLIGLNLPWGILNLYGIYIILIKFRKRIINTYEILILSWFFSILLVISLSKTFYVRYLIPLYIPYTIIGAIGMSRLVSNDRYFCILKKIGFVIVFLLFFRLTVLPVDLYYYGGTNYYDMYRTLDYLHIHKDKVFIYKEKFYKLNQGLAYYTNDILPAGYISNEDELFINNRENYVYLTSYNYLMELINSSNGDRIECIAYSKPKNWAIFRIKNSSN